MLGSLRLGSSLNTHWHKIVPSKSCPNLQHDAARQSEKMLLSKRREIISIAVKHTFLSAIKMLHSGNKVLSRPSSIRTVEDCFVL